jgi:hypothetical protein
MVSRLQRVRCISGLVSSGLPAAFLVVACVLASPARADETDERAQDVIDALRDGDVPLAGQLLAADGLPDRLADRPALVHVVCDRAYRCDDAFRAAPAPARRGLASTLLAVARQAHDGAPEDVRGLWALSHALVLKERAGPPEGAAAWLRAADLLETAHASAPGDGEALGYAVTFLLEGALLEPDDQHGLIKRAAAVGRSARRAHPKSAGLATTLASAQLWAADALLEENRKASKAALSAVFEQLEPHARKDIPRSDVAALWNDAVTLDARGRFALRKRYLTAPADALNGAVVFDVPVSPRWTVTRVPGNDDSPGYVYVSQTDASGTLQRQLLFRSYTWGFGYTFTGPNEVKGDNVKNLARGLRDVSAERVFAPGADGEPVRKARVGRDFVGQSFEVGGNTRGEEPSPLTLHGYCVRGSHQRSFGFLVYVYRDDGEIGPEMEAVLGSLREPED